MKIREIHDFGYVATRNKTFKWREGSSRGNSNSNNGP